MIISIFIKYYLHMMDKKRLYYNHAMFGNNVYCMLYAVNIL